MSRPARPSAYPTQGLFDRKLFLNLRDMQAIASTQLIPRYLMSFVSNLAQPFARTLFVRQRKFAIRR